MFSTNLLQDFKCFFNKEENLNQISEKVDIYHLPKWRDIPFSPIEQEKINRISSQNNIIGMAFIQEKESSNLSAVYVEKLFRPGCEDSTLYLVAYTLMEDITLGSAEIFIKDRNKDPYVTGSYGPINNKESENISRIFINHLENFSQTHNSVGILLIKSVIQIFKEEYDGRINLAALGATPTYYYKLGFRSEGKEHDKTDGIIKDLIDKGITDCKNYDLLGMYLPKESREAWFEDIKDNPIRFPAN